MLTVLILALALATDAFAAAVGQGAAAGGRSRAALALKVGAAFGVAQALMPIAGWGLGVAFDRWMRDLDHWIAFVLLVAIGVRMLREATNRERAATPNTAVAGGWTLATMAIATSIDAAAAGVTLPLLALPPLVSCVVIGVVTFVLATLGVHLGARAGAMIGRPAEAAGGIVLILLGCKILVDHLYFGG